MKERRFRRLLIDICWFKFPSTLVSVSRSPFGFWLLCTLVKETSEVWCAMVCVHIPHSVSRRLMLEVQECVELRIAGLNSGCSGWAYDT